MRRSLWKSLPATLQKLLVGILLVVPVGDDLVAVEGAWDSKSPLVKKRQSREVSDDKELHKKAISKASASTEEPTKKKAKMHEKDTKGSPVEMKTPSFSRFGSSRTGSVSSARRSTSAPRHRPSATPSSSCKTPSSVYR